jgi:hypothetical protein
MRQIRIRLALTAILRNGAAAAMRKDSTRPSSRVRSGKDSLQIRRGPLSGSQPLAEALVANEQCTPSGSQTRWFAIGMLSVMWLLVAEYFLVMALTGERNLIKAEGCGGRAGLLYGAGGYGWDACLSGGLEGGKSDWTPEKEDVSLRQLNSMC